MSKKMSTDTNAINWFEIAANDIDRAKKFYEAIFDVQLTSMEMMGMKMAMFPPNGTNGTVGGSLVQSKMHKPGSGGTVLYLNANPDLESVLKRVEKAGGKITMSKTLIDPNTGYMGFITDSEGNTVGLHSNN